MKPIDYKSRYYRLLVTFWIMIVIGSCFFGYMFHTLNQLDKDIQKFDQDSKTKEIIEIYIENGWMPHDTVKEIPNEN